MRSSFSMFLLYHAYVYLEFLILACTIYILAPTSAYIRSSSLKPHQHTSEALLSSHTKQSPKLRISINQSISQPIRPTIFFHNYNPKSSKNKFKYYTKTLQYIQTSLYSPIPSRQTAKNSPHPHPTQRRCPTPLADCLSVRPSLHSSHKKRAPRPKHPGTLPKPNNIISPSAASSAPSPTDPLAPSPSTYSPSLHSAPVQSLE